MKLGRLTKVGINRFSEYLDELETDLTTSLPPDLLSHPTFFEVIDDETIVAPHPFRSRWEAARYLNSLLSTSDISNAENDIGLWTALTAFYFDILCPLKADGTRKLRERAAYIPQPGDYKRYYRHLLLGPYLIYRAHLDKPERAIALLCKPPHLVGELEAQIGAYQELVTNPAVVELVTRLYYDPKTGTTKPGAGSKGPGSPRRLVTVLNQLDLTWDLYATTPHELMKLVPEEFMRFRIA